MSPGWKTKRLGDIAEVQSGGTPLVHNRSYWDGDIAWYSSGELNNLYTSAPERHISRAGLDNSNAKLFPAGSLLVGMYDTAALKMSILDRPAAFNQAIAGAKPNDQVDMVFILHAISAIKAEVLEHRRGVRQKNLSLGKIKDIQIPLPTLSEQRRIVGILDEAFEGIATAKANAEKNLQNAHALFDSHLHSTFAQVWRSSDIVPLSDLATDITDGDHMPPPKAERGIPFITIGNIGKASRTIDFSETFMVPREYFDGLKANRRPQSGDVLYTVTGSFGIPVLIDQPVEFCFQRHIALIRPKSTINSAWLAYLLLSPQVFSQADEGATGTAQRTVSLTALRGFAVPKVPISLQCEMVSLLDATLNETTRLASIYEQKLAALDELKRSLLHQAFSGEL